MNRTTKFIKDNFDIDGLYEEGIIDTKTDYKKIEKRLCMWFGYRTIYEYAMAAPIRWYKVKVDLKTFSEN